MAINDILHGLLALGSGAGKAYAVKKQRELDQRDEFQRALVQMENQARLAERDTHQFDRWDAQTELGKLRAGIEQQNANTKEGFLGVAQQYVDPRIAEINARIANYGVDNALAQRRFEEYARNNAEELKLVRERLDAQYPMGDDGKRKPAPRAAGGGSGKTIALQSFKQQLLKSGELFGVPPSANEATRVSEMDQEFFDTWQREIGAAGLKIGGLMNKADIEKLDAITKELLQVYDEENAGE